MPTILEEPKAQCRIVRPYLILVVCWTILVFKIPDVSSAQENTQLISPGRSIGPLVIGETRESAIKAFGNPTDELKLESDCPPWTIHWVDFANGRSGVFAYLKNGRIFQIQAETPRYATDEGIKSDSSPAYVRQHYGALRSYQLKGSASQTNGGRDLIYWVDSQKGIAFELRYNQKARKRLVSYIFVFDPHTNFQPEGCVSIPQQWHQLRSSALEPPTIKPKTRRRE